MSDNIYNILQKINDVEPVHQPQIDSTIEMKWVGRVGVGPIGPQLAPAPPAPFSSDMFIFHFLFISHYRWARVIIGVYKCFAFGPPEK